MKDSKVFRTNIVLALACLVAYYFFPSAYWIIASGVILLISVAVFPLAKWLAIGWMKFAEAIGAFNAKLLLIILYYVAVTPWSFIVGLIREDPMHRRRKDRSTMFETRNATFEPEDFERIS